MHRILHGAGAVVRNVFFILIILIGALAVLVIISTKSDRTQTNEITAAAGDVKENTEQLLKLAHTNKKLLRTVLDCTEPEGKCNQRGQAQTAAAVNLITVSDGLYVICGLMLDPTSATYQADVVKCVNDRITEALPAETGP